MKPLLRFALLLLLAVPAYADKIVTQIAYADDGLIYIENPGTLPNTYRVTYPDGSQCSGSLAPSGVATCATRGTWAVVNESVSAYIRFAGKRFYGVPQYYGRSFFTGSGTGFALVNPYPYQIEVSFVLYTRSGFPLAGITGALAPGVSLSMFASQLFPNINFQGQTYMLAIGAYSLNAVMVAECSGWTCEQQ